MVAIKSQQNSLISLRLSEHGIVTNAGSRFGDPNDVMPRIPEPTNECTAQIFVREDPQSDYSFRPPNKIVSSLDNAEAANA